MPRIKSSIKDVRRTKRRRQANKIAKSTLRTALRAARAAADPKERQEALRRAYSAIDKSVQHGLIPKNTGSRYKQRLAKSAKAAPAAA